MERTRVWRGSVRSEAREGHEKLVGWLGSAEAAIQFAKYGLSGYTLAQRGDDLTIAMMAEEPTQVIRFLRNPRMWPDFWEFRTSGSEPIGPAAGNVRVRWRRAE